MPMGVAAMLVSPRVRLVVGSRVIRPRASEVVAARASNGIVAMRPVPAESLGFRIARTNNPACNAEDRNDQSVHVPLHGLARLSMTCDDDSTSCRMLCACKVEKCRGQA